MSYVRTYDNVLPPILCRNTIDKFEKNVDQQKNVVLDGHRSFTEINLNQNSNFWKKEIDYLMSTLHNYVEVYKKDVGVDEMAWPQEYGFEELRMKRYSPNDKDEIQFHVDVENHDSARRFLVFFWYLNDVHEGGETMFQLNKNVPPKVKVQPREGKLLIFPPLWTHPHIASRPVDTTKYIIGGYLHYL
jgi:hypothetical protein